MRLTPAFWVSSVTLISANGVDSMNLSSAMASERLTTVLALPMICACCPKSLKLDSILVPVGDGSGVKVGFGTR